MQAGREIIEKQQQPDEMVGMLVPMFEAFLAEPATTELHDRIRQANLHARHSPYRRPGFALRLHDHLSPTPPELAPVAYTTRLCFLQAAQLS